MGGRKTFQRLLTQQGLDGLDAGTISRLKKIIANLPQVMEWHSSLPVNKQIAYASPSVVNKHCPVFVKRKQSSKSARPLKAALSTVEQLEARIKELEEELASAKSRQASKSKPALATARPLTLVSARNLYGQFIADHCCRSRMDYTVEMGHLRDAVDIASERRDNERRDNKPSTPRKKLKAKPVYEVKIF
jgi:hypothetical protein